MSEKWFRAPVARGVDGTVDRENNVIYGYSVMEKGMARGHGEEIDDETLDQVVALGNGLRTGAKSRFGHPEMSSDALGTFLGRAKKFRRVGDKVVADLRIDPTAFSTPKGDLGSYVMSLAESDPNAFGSSVVIKRDRVYRLNEDGTKKKGEDGKDLPPLVRVKELLASDFVDSPAATSGAFSGTNVLLSSEASAILDDVLSRPDAADRILSFVNTYIDNRQRKERNVSEETKPTSKSGVLSEGEQLDVLELQRAAFENDREALLRDRVDLALDRDLGEFREKIEPAKLEKMEPILRNLKTAELRGSDGAEEAGTQYANLKALLPSLASSKVGGELADSDDEAPVAGKAFGSKAVVSEERQAELAAKYPGMTRAISTIN